jgi:hypothetical protein
LRHLAPEWGVKLHASIATTVDFTSTLLCPDDLPIDIQDAGAVANANGPTRLSKRDARQVPRQEACLLIVGGDVDHGERAIIYLLVEIVMSHVDMFASTGGSVSICHSDGALIVDAQEVLAVRFVGEFDGGGAGRM